ncbi:MAG: alpha/beta hydrolase [Pseudomonadota bacterium]
MERAHTIQHLWKGETTDLAVRSLSAAPHENTGSDTNTLRPGFVWLGGFRSDMTGTKAQAMVEHCQAHGLAAMRFDYSGHGQSGGAFVDGTISRWVAESLHVLETATTGPQVLVGSSMGGWIALRVALELQKVAKSDLLAGLLLIAPAPDFTQILMEPEFTAKQKQVLEAEGFIEEPSEYSDEPTIITRSLIEDGRDNAVLDEDLAFGVPIHILQGMADPDVPHTHALRLVDALVHDDVTLTLIKQGDHRLSRDEDIATLKRTMDRFVF